MTSSMSSNRSTMTPSFNLSWVKGYLDLIVSGISLEQLLRRTHEEIGTFYPISFSQLFAFDQKGSLTPTTTFGSVPDGSSATQLSKDELHPVTDCARTEDSLAIPSALEYNQRYLELSWGHGPAIFIPLRVGPLVDGVFAMIFERDQEINWSEMFELHEAIFVIAQLAHLLNHKGSVVREASNASDPAMNLGLSDRQLVIAKMIAQGMTNRTIAKELGFSEATIRYETIKLYERLRVKNRSHAAARIHQLGIS
jgi:DNA-binding CsgD family transcriptional regulator